MGEQLKRKVPYLVVDTSAFIKSAPLQELGENIVTVPEVVNEIKNKRQLRRLIVLPYDLQVKDALPENIKFVNDFSKQTGDFSSLSATDASVIALTYQLEKKLNGVSHLNSAPTHKPSVEGFNTVSEELINIAGFHLPKRVSKAPENLQCKELLIELLIDLLFRDKLVRVISVTRWVVNFVEQAPLHARTNSFCRSDVADEGSECDSNDFDDAREEVDTDDYDEEVKLAANDDNTLEENFKNVKLDCGSVNAEESNNDDCDDDNDSDWITPTNLKLVKNKMANDLIDDLKGVTVACLTTDYAMQNVLKQIGLHVISMDGKLIKELRTFILRCYGCFKTTSIMTKVFCPNCGNKTLKKVATSLDSNGTQHIHINFRKPLTARGKRYSLPRPKGGKHSNNPILCEDQPMPQQKPSRLSKTKNNPLNEDYIAGYSPFVMRDVTSKSAMLGIKPHIEMKHRMRRNPNEGRKYKK